MACASKNRLNNRAKIKTKTCVFLLLDAGHVFKPPTPSSHRADTHVCPRHGRERRKVLENKPVRPVRSIQPKPVKPVRKTRDQLEAKEDTLVKEKKIIIIKYLSI